MDYKNQNDSELLRVVEWVRVVEVNPNGKRVCLRDEMRTFHLRAPEPRPEGTPSETVAAAIAALRAEADAKRAVTGQLLDDADADIHSRLALEAATASRARRRDC